MKRNKICLAMILALMFMLSISVNAEAGYAPDVNSYTNSLSDGAKTVIIYKGTAESEITSENIYYINQCDNAEGFSNLEMMMKADAPVGEYTLLTNGGNTTTFEITVADVYVSGSTEVEFLGAQLKNGSYSAAFGLKAELLLSDASKLTMVMGDKAYTTDIYGAGSIISWGTDPVATEDGQLTLAIQMDNIGEEYMTEVDGKMVPEFKLYFK